MSFPSSQRAFFSNPLCESLNDLTQLSRTSPPTGDRRDKSTLEARLLLPRTTSTLHPSWLLTPPNLCMKTELTGRDGWCS